ncbi:MAG: S-layer homology domain-containing protein [Clostridia bacterium]|nr:S-layer homology domain-containing protein [Clostridia bacterium]
MKKAIIVIISVILVFAISAPAFAARAEGKNQAQECEQARLQVRDRLQLSDQAVLRYQERLKLQEKSGLCFSDMQEHWASEQVSAAHCWGLINGYPDGSFNPNGNITGTEGVLMMSRLMNCTAAEDQADVSETDVDWSLVPEWARAQMKEKTALRIATQSQCYGNAKLNRLQFAVMLAKATGIEPEISEDTVAFLDLSEIPEEYLGYIEALKTLGIIQGSDGCFYADQTVTRAEAAAMLTRILEVLEQ